MRSSFVIAYDISNNKARRKLCKILDKYGVRLQMSLYEFYLSDSERRRLEAEIDSFYFKAQSARMHKGNNTLKIAQIPICKSCFERRNMYGEDFTSQQKMMVI